MHVDNETRINWFAHHTRLRQYVYKLFMWRSGTPNCIHQDILRMQFCLSVT